jgi:hypothetical protein
MMSCEVTRKVTGGSSFFASSLYSVHASLQEAIDWAKEKRRGGRSRGKRESSQSLQKTQPE